MRRGAVFARIGAGGRQGDGFARLGIEAALRERVADAEMRVEHGWLVRHRAQQVWRAAELLTDAVEQFLGPAGRGRGVEGLDARHVFLS
jgi:hypothetical protein